MSLAEVDAALDRYEAAIEVMTANLVDLENNPTNKLLDPASLSGITQQRVAAARQTIAALWAHFGEFKDLVERARELRGRGGHVPQSRTTELERLLAGPSITLPPIDVPLAHRGLYTPAETPVATTPDQLLADMGAAFDAAKGEVLAVDAAWRALVPRLEVAQRTLAKLASSTTAVGESDTTLDRVRHRIDELGTEVSNDPLSAKVADLDEVEASLATLGSRFEKLAQDRQTLERDLDAGQATIDQIVATLTTGEAALAETRAKIAGAQGLLAPLERSCLTDAERGLGPWLERLRQLSANGDWRSACRGLDQWERVAAETLTAAESVARANAAPVRQRNELRGRLDAFAAKAERLGLTEDADLSVLREQARTVLYSAPTDLDVAMDLVTRYGASLTGGRS